ncbi:hypothetical protein QE374_001216 [Microbacterium sp. SORGH_AS428]|uniref:hypothetical protein n=1 Tax=Microbacterium sp. SORGH_AS_0428 TaxID=3041788 RepID=UPI0028645609|nr:hypothetical protein [Microbacterium sp. SORGH_AS_0428]MDR6199307.1 hypothetical protein [Microbacterium sp. SORGH_AS_0428]
MRRRRAAATTSGRLFAVAAALALTAMLASGCTGDGEAGAFAAEFGDDAAVASVELTSHDNQPFTGGVSGQVVARDGLADHEVSALADRLSSYTRENGERMRGLVSLLADDVELIVTGHLETDAAAVGTALALRADERVVSAEIAESFIALVGADVGAAVELIRGLPELTATAPPEARSELFVRTQDRVVDVGDAPPRVAGALAAWDALVAEVPLTGMRLRDDALVMTLAQEADYARAAERAASLLPQAEPRLAFASDIIRLGEADGARARDLVGRLDASELERIAYVWESGSRLQIAVTSKHHLDAVARSVTAALPEGTTEAWVVVDGDSESRVDLVVP